MRPLLYSINVTLDGCVHHNAVPADEALLNEQLRATHAHATETIARADALLFGRTTYQMMEGAWRLDTRTTPPSDWQMPFARTIDGMRNTSCRARSTTSNGTRSSCGETSPTPSAT